MDSETTSSSEQFDYKNKKALSKRDPFSPQNCLRGFLRGLIIGYGIRAAIGLITALITKRMYKKYVLNFEFF